MEEEENGDKKGIVLFGQDISKIPCFRDTFLVSIPTGIGFGLLQFMFTSNITKACRNGMGAYVITTIGYWCYCRYNYTINKFNMSQIPKTLRKDYTKPSE